MLWRDREEKERGLVLPTVLTDALSLSLFVENINI
jgi:hypothetical protein